MSYTRFFFFFNDTATTEIYTLSLHDALPISFLVLVRSDFDILEIRNEETYWWKSATTGRATKSIASIDRKSTRLNSSHQIISYAVFCLKKKKNKISIRQQWYLVTRS